MDQLSHWFACPMKKCSKFKNSKQTVPVLYFDSLTWYFTFEYAMVNVFWWHRLLFFRNKMNLPWIIRKYVEILEFAFRSLLMNNAKLWIIFKIKTHWIKMDFSLDWSVDLEQHILVWQLLNSPTIWSNQILILKSDQFFVRVELTAYCFHPHNIFLSSESVWRGSIIC